VTGERLRIGGLALFLGGVLLLGARPFVPGLNTLWPGCAIGAWNMYRSRVDARLLTSVRDGDREVYFSGGEAIWHNAFILTAHGDLRPDLVEQFAEFLSRGSLARAAADGQGYSPDAEVVVELVYRVNNQPEVRLEARRRLAPAEPR